MKSLATFILGLLALSHSFASIAAISGEPTGIEYDAKSAFVFPESLWISEYNNAVGRYNQEVRVGSHDANFKVLLDEYKADALEAKAKVEKEQARLKDLAEARKAIPFPTCAQIPWGSTPRVTLELMEKHGAQADGDNSDTEQKFTGGTFGGDDVSRWTLRFVNGGLFSVQVYFKSHSEALELFRHWNELLAKKYKVADRGQDLAFQGFFTVKDDSFKDVAQTPEKSATVALAVNAMFQGQWRPLERWNFPNGSRIDLMAISTDAVMIGYVNGELEKAHVEAAQKAHADGQKDF